MRRWLLTHDYWLAGNLVTTVEAAEMATIDLGRNFTRRQIALMAGKVCSYWPKSCRRMIATSRRPTALSAAQWERVMTLVRSAVNDSTSIGSAAQVARMIGGRYAVSVIHEALRSIGFDFELNMREEKPKFI